MAMQKQKLAQNRMLGFSHIALPGILAAMAMSSAMATEYWISIHKTMKGRFTQVPTSSPYWCDTAAGSAGIFTVDHYGGEPCLRLDEEPGNTNCEMTWGEYAGVGVTCIQSTAHGECWADGGYINYAANISGVSPFIVEDTYIDIGDCVDSQGSCSILGSWVTASADVAMSNITAPIEYLNEMTVQFYGTFSRESLSSARSAEHPKRIRITVNSPAGETHLYGRFIAGQFTIEGLSPTSESSSTNSKTYTFSLGSGTASPSSGTFGITALYAADEGYDMNGDGAFNAADVQWIRDNYRTIDVNTENPYSVPGNFVVTWPSTTPTEAINSDDADFLDDILDRIGPSFAFGDFNRDGVVDCRDAWGSTPYFGVSIGDPDYRYELDADHDGVVDNDDKAAFFALVNHCDFNQDEIVDDADFIIFSAAYNLLDCEDVGMPANCPADLNLDGFVDEADFGIFEIRYNLGEC